MLVLGCWCVCLLLLCSLVLIVLFAFGYGLVVFRCFVLLFACILLELV